LTLYGKLFLEGKLIREAEAGDDEAGRSFRDSLENCLLGLCASLEIPAPLWLKKNTREFAVFRRTFFTREQFIEKVWFDKFEISLR
jgi:pectin methylesterase-like acyl-CoA thioesterase